MTQRKHVYRDFTGYLTRGTYFALILGIEENYKLKQKGFLSKKIFDIDRLIIRLFAIFSIIRGSIESLPGRALQAVLYKGLDCWANEFFNLLYGQIVKQLNEVMLNESLDPRVIDIRRV